MPIGAATADGGFAKGIVKDTMAITEQPIIVALARRIGESTLSAGLNAVSSLLTLSLPGSSVPMRKGELHVVLANVIAKVAQVTGFVQQVRDLM